MIHQRFRFNLQFKVLGEFFARISAFLLYAAAARLLGTDQFGFFSLSFSIAIFTIVFLEMGTNSIITRNLARKDISVVELISTTTTFKFLLIIPIVLVLNIVLRIFHFEKELINLTNVMVFVALGIGFGEHISAILSGLEKMNVEANLKLFWRLGSLVLAVLLFQAYQNIYFFVIGMALGQWAGVIISFIWIHFKVQRFTFSIKIELLKKMLRVSFPLFAAWLFVVIYDRQSVLFMSFFSFSNIEIGLFSASIKLLDAIRPIPVLFMSALFPILSEAALRDRFLFQKISTNVFKHAVVVLVPVTWLLMLFSAEIIQIIFGANYVLSAPVFEIAIWAFVGIFLNHVLLQLMISTDGQMKFLQGAVVVAISNALLCYWLIPLYGIQGGAWALVGSEVIFLVFNMFSLSVLFHADNQSIFKSLFYPILFIFCVAVGFIIFRHYVAMAILTPIFGVLYCILAIKFKFIDLDIFKKLMK